MTHLTWKKSLTWIDHRAFGHYEAMECVARGMYKSGIRDDVVASSVDVLISLGNYAEIAFDACPVSASIHLTNNGINKRAYCGQISCCVACGARACETSAAWGILSDNQKALANAIAEKEIRAWVMRNLKSEICRQQNVQLEFQFLRQLA